jgi:hypothetical protein
MGISVEEFFAAALTADKPSYGELASTIYDGVWTSAEEGLWWHMSQSNCERAAIVLNRLGLIEPTDEAEAVFRLWIDPKDVSALAETKDEPKPSYEDLINVVLRDFLQCFGSLTPFVDIVKSSWGERMLAQLIKTGFVIESPDHPSGIGFCEVSLRRVLR